MLPSLRVAVVEDDAGIRKSLCDLLDGAPGFTCVAAFSSVEDAAAHFDGGADVVLMDIGLPGLSGIEGVGLLRARHPAVPIVMLTVFDDPERVFEALKAGAVGYLLKRTPPAELLAALEDVRAGGAPMSGSVARNVVESFRLPASPEAGAALSAREREVLALLAQGYRYREVAEALFVSPETVRTHIRRIYEKLHVRSRAEAVLRWTGH